MRLITITFFVCISYSFAADDFSAKITPFLKKNCIGCHGEKKQKGKFRLDTLSMDFSDLEVAEQWQAVLDELNSANMPPEDEPQPSREELTSALELLTYRVEKAKKQHYGKNRETVMRRLNRREYINSVYDLTGIRLAEKDVLADQSAAEYDTHGDGLFMSAFSLNRYRALANTALDLAMVDRAQNKPLQALIEGGHTYGPKDNEPIRKRMAAIKKRNFIGVEVKKGKKIKGKKGKRGPDIKIEFDQKPEYENLKIYLAEEGVNKNRIFNADNPGQGFRLGRQFGAKGEMLARIRVTCEVKNLQPGERAYMTVCYNPRQIPSQSAQFVDITHTHNKQQEVVVERLWESNGSIPIALQIWKNGRTVPQKKIISPDGKTTWFNPHAAKILIHKVHVEGPITGSDDFPVKKLFAGKKQKDGESETDYAARLIKDFAFRAYRHQPASDNFLAAMNKLYKMNREKTRGLLRSPGKPGKGVSKKLNFYRALKKPFAVILSSPKFLYLSEGGNGTKQVGNLELASRLSYFLWSSPPDNELYELAQAGKLHQNDVLKKQVARMTLDSRSLVMSKGFMSQWLELEKKLDMVVVANRETIKEAERKKAKQPRVKRKPCGPQTYNQFIEKNLKEEPAHFFQALASRNASLTNMVDSKIVTVNRALAQYYGLTNFPKNIPEGEFATIKLPKGSARGGLLGQGIILAMTSNGERSSPTKRGDFVLTKMMGMVSPPPPPNVPDIADAATGTIKEQLLNHQKQPQCASCHKRIDPAGFGLEPFDQTGKWINKLSSTASKATTGKLPGGSIYKSFPEFKQKLLKYKDGFAKSFVRNLASYAFGRRIGFSDAAFIDELLKKAKANEYKVQDLISAIVCSDEFKLL